ncbi:MAG: hypothetical protein PHV21_07015, partial [Synergistaceae bacterium]|nr:hypothetical protein [Synergistaceae bacterium]
MAQGSPHIAALVAGNISTIRNVTGIASVPVAKGTGGYVHITVVLLVIKGIAGVTTGTRTAVIFIAVQFILAGQLALEVVHDPDNTEEQRRATFALCGVKLCQLTTGILLQPEVNDLRRGNAIPIVERHL